MPQVKKPILDRFFARLPEKRDLDSCWKWQGTIKEYRYGVLNRGGRGEGYVYAHRLSYEIHEGDIPEGMNVCHHCDNPPCVNPAHLFLGT